MPANSVSGTFTPAVQASGVSASIAPSAAEFSTLTAVAMAGAVLVMHILTNVLTPYGFHRDEFLYLAMGDHLRLWQMDFPPFIAIVARASHALFGPSLPGIRLAPAFAHAGLVYAAAFATALYGGRRSAQMLAALSITLCPFFLRSGSMLQPVVFDQLWWTLALLGISLRIHDNDPKHWFGTGLFLGLGALTKFSVAFIAAGFVVALLTTSLRKDLFTKWPWISIIVATVIGHPSVTGQILLGWPVRGQLNDLQGSQLSHVSPLDFLTGQFSAGPVLLLAIGGFVWLFKSRRWGARRTEANTAGSIADGSPVAGSPVTAMAQASAQAGPDYRPVAVIVATAFLILLAMRGKAYYIAPIYPILTAAGAAALDRLALRIAPSRPSKVLAVAAATVALYGMLTLPFGLPLLPPVDMAEVTRLLGQESRSNMGERLPLEQDYADMLGWPELVAKTARVWHALPASDTANAVIIGTNYGRAGAIDLLGRDLGLPRTISPVGSYWFFGPGNKSGKVAVIPANNAEALAPFYSECTSMAQTSNPRGVPEEQVVHIYVCRGARGSMQDAWPGLAGQN